MPNTSSAKKALRQNQKRRIHNRQLRSKLRTFVKKVRLAADAGDQDAAQAALREAQKQIDQAASKKLIHKNTASRTKSRLSRYVKSKLA
ncbi:MAG: 30S ribosomal protein S20 [Planctomycetaceae bacterium]|nr:30S ribosomal protein S20 [Planctomycetaceae bacterium]